MSRRARLIIYDGPDKWIEATKLHEHFKPGTSGIGNNMLVHSMEIDPGDLKLLFQHGYPIPDEPPVQSDPAPAVALPTAQPE